MAMRPLFAHLSDEKARVYGLVLSSADIPHQTRQQGHQWAMTVSATHRRAAIQAIALYLKENPVPSDAESSPAATGFNSLSAFYIAAVLGVIHGAIQPGYEHRVFVETLGADAAQILAGNIHRCITALLLHSDWPHVVNNMAGIILFGTVAVSRCGWGAGWLMILLSGAAGNLITAIWYRQGHIAIGASTAVFGALGICVALNLWRYAKGPRPYWRMWLPLAAGLALLGFLGSSPHSDLMAHLSGFGAGLTIGGVYGWRRSRPPGTTMQWSAAILSLAWIALSWVYGIYCQS